MQFITTPGFKCLDDLKMFLGQKSLLKNSKTTYKVNFKGFKCLFFFLLVGTCVSECGPRRHKHLPRPEEGLDRLKLEW